MNRFYSAELTPGAKTVVISDPEEIHHLKDVLRMTPGDPVYIFNGTGLEAEGTIIKTGKRIHVNVVRSSQIKSEHRTPVILACAIPKRTKFEDIIDKCTQVGVDEIIPVLTRRTEVRPAPERWGHKHKRHETIALNAVKQCKRSIIPVIHPPARFDTLIYDLADRADFSAVIPALREKQTSLLTALTARPVRSRLMIFIGPEGDFTEDELDQAERAGCAPVTLGPHVLRVDTAAVCSVAIARQVLD